MAHDSPRRKVCHPDAVLGDLGQCCDQARGFLLNISEAFPIGKVDVARVIHMQTAGEAMARRMPRVPCDAIMVPKSAEALGAFGFWAEALASWDGKCLCVLKFGPCCTWQALGRLDASTDWGCGGFLLLNRIMKGFKHEWSPEERAR